MAETPTPRTDAMIQGFATVEEIITHARQLETDLQHLAMVAEEALERADDQLQLDGYLLYSRVRQDIKSALSEITRIKNQTI